MNKIGIITGHGLDLSDVVANGKDHFMNTPYGKPSAHFLSGKIDKTDVVVLKRHGSESKIPAFLVNYKANISVLREMGCTLILATSVCGSLQEEIMVGEFVVFDQFIDLTKHRELTYHENIPLSELNHSAFNNPFSNEIRDSLIEASVIKGYTIHTKGTVIAVDGPRQSTRAESNLFRHWGADVVNTTTVPEAILSHELGIPYGAISLCTYYDTWRTDIDPATRQEKDEVIQDNSKKLRELVLTAISKL
ncbi:MAG: MTAP family purine nucleoside phosphorylase [Bacteroidales bacterium]|nr:MTAP family purine nucleoside phosphorylase [Bacteroidales bacterium]